MTLSTFTDNGYLQTSDATFRTWATSWDTAIKAVGLVNVAQTGEMNYGTVTKPGVANTKAGFTVYSFNDANQASYPCYIRVDYGTGSTSNYGSLWVTVGTSVDGSGVIGAIKSPVVQFQSSTASSVTSGCSGTSSRLTIIISLTGQTYTAQSFFSIERILDSSGNDTTTGLVFTWIKYFLGTNTYTANGQQVLYFTGSQPPATHSAAQQVPGTNLVYSTTLISLSNGNNIALLPVIPVGKTTHYPMKGLLGYMYPDITPLTYPSISTYGTSRTYYCPGLSTYYMGAEGAQRVQPLILWE